MFSQQIIDKISQQITDLLKASPLNDFEKNFKAILHASLDKLDLVSREEFDIQQKVLLNTRQKLVELEQIIKKIEKTPTLNQSEKSR